MTVLGICGQSGAGKTTALNIFSEMGAVICDSDSVSRQVMSKGMLCADEVIGAFGSDICRCDGEIDRKKLAGIVFFDSEKLARLTEITHRYIKKEIRTRISQARADGESLFVLDAPLLFESGLDADCDLTLALVAERSTRIARIKARDGIATALAEKRIDSQLDEAELRRRVDEVIENNTTALDFAEKIKEFAERRGLVNEKK